jgi:ABC-type dipeptide/oligopeptide/nickel transport system permease component
MGRAAYFASRLAVSFITFVVLLSAVFFFLRVLPGDPVLVLVPEGASESVLAQVRHSIGLDQPLYLQYYEFMSSVFSLNLGYSWISGAKVVDIVLNQLPTSIELATLGTIFGSIFGVFGGVWAAKNKGNFSDRSFRFLTLLFYAIPVFISGPLLQYLIGIKLGLLPVTGRISEMVAPTRITGFILIDAIIQRDFVAIPDWLGHLLIPAAVLGLYLSATLGRVSRVEALGVMKEDFVLTATAKGLSEGRVVFKHVLPNALIPIITALGFQLAALMGGMVIIESIFDLPGVGRLLVSSLATRDFPLIQGTLIFTVTFIVLMSIIIDLLYGVIDPRVKY